MTGMRFVTAAAVACAWMAILVLGGVGLWIAFSDVPIIGAAEPNVIYTLQKYLAGRPLYGNPDEPPFDVTQYSPLYYVITGAIGALAGVEATDAQAVWRLGRLTAFVLAVCALGAHYTLLTRVLRVSRGIAICAVAYAFVATCPYLYYARPDVLLTLWTVVALLFLFRSIDQAGAAATRSVVAATAAVFLACASKQSGVATLGVLVLYLLVSREWRQLAAAAATIVACGLASVLLVGSVDAAHNLEANIVDGVQNGVDYYHGVLQLFIPYVRSEIILIAGMVILVLRVFGPVSAVERLFAIALPVLFAFAAATGLKVGSGPNYFNEFAFIGTAALAWAIERHRPEQGSQSILAALAICLIVLLPVRTTERGYVLTYGRSEPGSLTPLRSSQLSAYLELADFLKANTDPHKGEYVLTFDRGLMTLLPFHAVAPQTELALKRYEQGLSDMRAFRSLVEDGRIKYVVFLRGEIRRNYLGVDLQEHFGHLKDYRGQAVYEWAGRPEPSQTPAPDASLPSAPAAVGAGIRR